MSEESFHKVQYQQLGYTIFTNAVSKHLIGAMRSKVFAARDCELIGGDESTHSWREFPLAASDLPSEPVLKEYLASVLPLASIRIVHWLNIYRVDEYIEAHVDAGGEAQLMIPIEIPPSGGGGEIWIGANERLLPLGVGDALLFAAHRVQHGTTKVLDGQRVSLNARMWMH